MIVAGGEKKKEKKAPGHERQGRPDQEVRSGLLLKGEAGHDFLPAAERRGRGGWPPKKKVPDSGIKKKRARLWRGER